MRGMDMLNSAREKVNQSSPARERLALLFDQDSFVELDAFAKVTVRRLESSPAMAPLEGGACFLPLLRIRQLPAAEWEECMLQRSASFMTCSQDVARVIGIYDSKGARVDEGMDALLRLW